MLELWSMILMKKSQDSHSAIFLFDLLWYLCFIFCQIFVCFILSDLCLHSLHRLKSTNMFRSGRAEQAMRYLLGPMAASQLKVSHYDIFVFHILWYLCFIFVCLILTYFCFISLGTKDFESLKGKTSASCLAGDRSFPFQAFKVSLAWGILDTWSKLPPDHPLKSRPCPRSSTTGVSKRKRYHRCLQAKGRGATGEKDENFLCPPPLLHHPFNLPLHHACWLALRSR